MDKVSRSKLNHHYLGANSLVATDATCFMGWIVAQYELEIKQISTKNLARKYLSKQKP